MKNPYKSFSKVNPQPSTGDRRIENAIFQHLIAAGLPGAEYQCVLFIIDKTWGWGKKEDMISLKQFEDGTHIDRSYLFRILSSLETRRMIIVERTKTGGRGRSNTYMFNKHYDTWITPNSNKPDKGKSDEESLLEETPTTGHPSPLNSDDQSLNNTVTSGHSLGRETVTKPRERVTSHAQGKGDHQSPTKDTIKQIDTKDREVMKALATNYEQYIGDLTPSASDKLKDYAEEYQGEVAWIHKAFVEGSGKKSWPYIRAILDRYQKQGGPDDTGTGSTRQEKHDKVRRADKEPTDAEYLRSLGRGTGGDV